MADINALARLLLEDRKPNALESMADPSRPYIGNPNLQRQGVRAGVGQREDNFSGPASALMGGLFGVMPGEMGGSVLDPRAPRNYPAANNLGFALSLLGGAVPVAKAAGLPQHAMEMLRRGTERHMDTIGARMAMIKTEEGLPKTYYHGTSADFDKFSKSHGGKVWGDKASKAAHFFTADPYEADHFAAVAASRLGGEKRRIAANLDLQNPKTISPDELSAATKDWLRTLKPSEREFQMATKQYESPDGGISKPLEYAILQAKKAGHDGVVVKLDDGTDWAVSFGSGAIKRLP